MANFVVALTATAVVLTVLAAPAQAANGIFDRTWGENVVSAGPGDLGTGFEICVAANGDTCSAGTILGDAAGGEMNGPVATATDAAGNVYVADSTYNRIQKFNSAGVFERAWGEDVVSAGPGNSGVGFEICVAAVDNCKTGVVTGAALGGDLSNPGGVATDGAGNVYVVDKGHHRVQKFNSAGVFERAWGEDVASGGPGDTGTGFEICIAANGDTCKTGTTTVPALGGEMDTPTDVATDGAGNVYVSGLGDKRVQKFSSAGVFERAWGEDVASGGPGNTGTGFEICVAAQGDVCKTGIDGAGAALGGDLSNPFGVATDAGKVYVGDTGHNRVQRFNSFGVFERAWGEDVVSAGPGDTGTGFEICVAPLDTCKIGVAAGQAFGGELFAPGGIAIDGAGNIYVPEVGHNRVQKFSTAGVFERAWGEDVVSSGPGNAGTGFEICVAAVDTCKTGGTAGAALGGELSVPLDLATDGAGNVYVADTFHHRVQKYADPPASPAPAAPATPGGAAGPTGLRAAALKKCKKKKSKKARKKCKRKALRLPI